LVARRGEKMQKNKSFPEDKFDSCENYITLKESSELKNYCDFALKLSISILTIDNLTTIERGKIVETIKDKDYSVFSPKQIYEKVKDLNFSQKSIIGGFKSFISTNDENTVIIVSRKTIITKTIDDLKRKLSKVRDDFEIVSVVGKNKSLLKGAARDKRVDFISLDLLNNEIPLDDALCSLMKQNEKCFEIVLSPIMNSQNDKELSAILRNGKKIMKMILANNVPFILTVNPLSPFQLRTNNQLRYIGRLIGIPFNKSRNSVFEHQLTKIVNNTIKLHEDYVFEGVREV